MKRNEGREVRVEKLRSAPELVVARGTHEGKRGRCGEEEGSRRLQTGKSVNCWLLIPKERGFTQNART